MSEMNNQERDDWNVLLSALRDKLEGLSHANRTLQVLIEHLQGELKVLRGPSAPPALENLAKVSPLQINLTDEEKVRLAALRADFEYEGSR